MKRRDEIGIEWRENFCHRFISCESCNSTIDEFFVDPYHDGMCLGYKKSTTLRIIIETYIKE